MSIIAILDRYGKEVQEGIRQNLKEKKLQNTGKTAASIKYDVKEERGMVTLTVEGAAHIFSLESGAAPIKKKTDGKFIESIAKWARSKLGLNAKEARGLAFGYLRKRIGDGKGGATTKPDGSYFVPNRFNVGGVISDTVNDSLVGKINQEILKEVAENYISKVAVNIEK